MKVYRSFSSGNQVVNDMKTEACERHRVSKLTLRVPLSGNETYRLGSREIRIFPGYFAVFNAGASFTRVIDSLEPVKSLTISFEEGFLKDFNRRLASKKQVFGGYTLGDMSDIIPFSEALLPVINDFRYTVRNLKRSVDENRIDALLMDEYLYHCLLGYVKLLQSEVVNRAGRLNIQRPKARIETFKRVTRAKDYIISNFDRKISIEEVAEASFLSVNHLLRNFSDAFQISPYQYLIRVRLRRSRALLAGTALPVTDIASLIGFDNDSAFITLFKNNFRITPLQFRKLNAKTASEAA